MALFATLLATPAPVSAESSDGGVSSLLDVAAGDTQHVFATEVAWLADRGIIRACNPPDSNLFCVDDVVTRGQIAAFLVRALKIPAAKSSFIDTVGHLFEGDVAALAAAGITRGCNPPDNTKFCPDDPVTRGQMAALLVRAFGFESGNAGFVDTASSMFVADIAALAAAGVTRGCNPPVNDRFCPDDAVTRGQMAAFLYRGMELVPDDSGDSDQHDDGASDQDDDQGDDQDEGALPPPSPLPAPPLAIDTDSLSSGPVGRTYEDLLKASGGVGPYTWAASGLPAGLALDANTGRISGILPTEVGAWTVTVSASDSQAPAKVVEKTVTLEVVVAPGCEDNTSISDIECAALMAFAEGITEGSPTAWGGLDPCITWTGVFCSGGHVQALNFYGDGMRGVIAPELRFLTELTDLDLGQNQLEGSIPAELGELSKLESLHLDDNNLTGSIPASLGDLSELTLLMTNGNSLSDSIPDSLSQLGNLEALVLSGNNLSGSVPAWIGELTSLQHLDLSQNDLTGQIPATLGDLQDLRSLDLSENQLSGTVPATIDQLLKLDELYISQNNLSGSLPEELTDLASISYLELYGNGCFTASDDLTDYLTVLDPAWQDGCPLTFETPPFPHGTAWEEDSVAIVVTGGARPYTFKVIDGVLPPGLVLDEATGELHGAPNSGLIGQYVFRVRVTDAQGETQSKVFNVHFS